MKKMIRSSVHLHEKSVTMMLLTFRENCIEQKEKAWKEINIMSRICIYKLGPVQKAEIDLDKKMQVFIGTQASGKSTVCKVIYYCQKIRDYTLDFLMDREQFSENHENEYFNNYMKYLTKQFMGCFGKTTHMQQFKIEYTFGQNQITITLNEDGYIRLSLMSI